MTRPDPVISELKSRMRWGESPEARSGHGHTWHYDGVALVDDWNGCTMVNPACPDDLCILPYGHVGMLEGVHHLGTDSEPRWYGFELHPRGPNADQDDLIRLGWQRQREIFPDDPQ